LNVPDYFEIVKNPMCLQVRITAHVACAGLFISAQDVKEKIETGTYNEPNEFLEDINLICDNAMTYNPPDNDVYQMYALWSNFLGLCLTILCTQGS
jgi:hypothetical protein